MTDIHSCSYYCDRPECIKAQRNKLRDNLAQPEQTEVQRLIAVVRAQQITIDKLEAALAQPEQEQEPNDLTIAYMAGFSRGKDLAPQRTWVGLSDKLKVILVKNAPNWTAIQLIEETELLLKDKNT